MRRNGSSVDALNEHFEKRFQQHPQWPNKFMVADGVGRARHHIASRSTVASGKECTTQLMTRKQIPLESPLVHYVYCSLIILFNMCHEFMSSFDSLKLSCNLRPISSRRPCRRPILCSRRCSFTVQRPTNCVMEACLFGYRTTRSRAMHHGQRATDPPSNELRRNCNH
jgi:hypothetical protein